MASTTSVSARVAWPHPDFEGAFFPVSRVTNAQGYSVDWQVLELNRAIPSIWRGAAIDRSVLGTGFGVRMLQPSDVYTEHYRAVRYGILYVILLSQDYALLFGSLLLFTVLAALMLTTRRLDWGKIGESPSEP